MKTRWTIGHILFISRESRANKIFNNETFKKIIERREQWLNLPEKYGESSDVAAKHR